MQGIVQAARRVRETVAVVQDDATDRLGVAVGGRLGDEGLPVIAVLPPVYPEWLGDRGFTLTHGLRFPYVAGAMANGIATVDMVVAMAAIGGLGFFGAAGLEPERIDDAVTRLAADLDGRGLAWGSNLIHSPHEPDLEEAVAELYITRGVRRVSAAAYMGLTPSIVRYALTGVHERDGRIHRQNHVFAKISRPEVARRFLEPAPATMLADLVAAGRLEAHEAELGARLPIAENITVEADSGGHTDNQVMGALFPAVLRLEETIARERGYERPIFVGAAGGLGTPEAVAAAYAHGAAYVLTGTVNQACVESGLGETARALLPAVGPGDVAMAPAADMFELGAEVQVLARGTMFAVRARRLYDLYRSNGSLEELADNERSWLEKDIFRTSLDEAWAATRTYWEGRDPAELDKAERDRRHRMALLFRAYLGQSSRWAIDGNDERRMDYQIWCGPAMAAFNDWSRDSFLHEPGNRSVAQVALNLMEGAAVSSRAQQLRNAGVPVPAAAFDHRPRRLAPGGALEGDDGIG